MRAPITTLLAVCTLAGCASGGEDASSASVVPADRIEAIHNEWVFADIHAHPSRFHRANVESISREEVDTYQSGRIDLVVANVSSDAAYHGGYTSRDGSRPERLRGNDRYPLEPGEAFAFTLDRFNRILATADSGFAVLADSPEAVLAAKREGRLAIMPALEGADGLEGSVENLRELHSRGLRLVQFMHFLDNEIGGNQSPPHDNRGLSEYGRALVRESNRLGIIIDLAHANTPTIMDALETSTQPVVFSHTGVKALHDGDRYVTDEEIRAIAAGGGVIGIWPSASLETMDEMVRHIDHVRQLVGIDHVAIASDLRGMSYLDEFGDEANFLAIVEALMAAGFTDEETGKVMGGNFFRLWQQVHSASERQ